MSSGQQPPPRRVANVGSLLLTPQENESLFTFLGKKCVVSGRDPRRREVGVGRRRERAEGRAAGQASPGLRLRGGVPTPLPGSAARVRAVRAAAPATASGAAREWGVSVPEPRLARFKLDRREAPTRFSCTSGCIVLTGPLSWPSRHLLPLGLLNTRGLSSGSVGKGSPHMNETDHKVVFNPTLGFQEGMQSSASVRDESRKCYCFPWQSNGVCLSRNLAEAWLLLSSPLILFFSFFFLTLVVEGLLSPRPCAGEPKSVVVLDLLGAAK